MTQGGSTLHGALSGSALLIARVFQVMVGLGLCEFKGFI